MKHRHNHNGHGGLSEAFRKFSRTTSHVVGSSYAFVAAVLIIVVWAATYPLWENGDTWQLVINTATTIVTFLMVFLIQNTQNRDTLQIHLKLDELIRAIGSARNSMIDLESLSDEELHALEKSFCKVREDRQRRRRHHGNKNGEHQPHTSTGEQSQSPSETHEAQEL